MERWRLFTSIRERAPMIVATALCVGLAVPGLAFAQDPAAAAPVQDLLKFERATPVILAWQIKADKGKEFEEAWAGIKALIAKSENAELRAFGETLNKIFKVDAPPFDFSGNQAVTYIFYLDPPSTTHSYDVIKILYTYLGAGVEGSKVTRAEADPLVEKIKAGFLQIYPIWKLIKVG